MAQRLRVLFSNHKDWSSNADIHSIGQASLKMPVSPALREAETGGLLRLLGFQSSQEVQGDGVGGK